MMNSEKQVRSRCAREIASGRITAYSMPYSQFLEAVPSWPKPDTVSANFAVLNSIQDLGALFAAIGDRLAPSADPNYGLIAIRSGLHVCGMFAQRLPLFVLLLFVKVIC